MQLQDYDTTTRYATRILTRRRLTPVDARHEVIELVVEVEDQDFHVQVGQNVGVLAPGQSEIGQDHHFRLYSVADVPRTTAGGLQQFKLCVRRCTYLDPYSGEEYPGVASNYLCDLSEGDTFTVTGPYDQAFDLPSDNQATLLLIGAGTGIAPFRAFVKYIYTKRLDFRGRIVLFHGGETGLDLLYRNNELDDFALYYDRDTFEAINALSKRPGWSDTIDWASALEQRGEEFVQMLKDPHTFVYLAGLRTIRDELDRALEELVEPTESWSELKVELEADGRWIELLY